MSTITYPFLVEVALYIVGNPSAIYHKCSINNVMTGTKLLHSMVVKSNNGRPIYHVLQGLITNTDNMIIFVLRGAATSVQGLYLLDNESTSKK